MPFLPRIAAGAALVLVPALLQPAALAASKPDLVVPALHLSSASVVRGASVTIRDTTRNVGGRGAGRSATGYFLSKDRARSSGDTPLGSRAVPALAAGQSSSGRHAAVIPARTGAGHWYVLACADAARKVVESNEANNCRSVALTVTAPASGYFPRPAAPLTVTPAFGSGTLTSGYPAAYSTDPNTFTETGPDGTTYTLDVPAGAVAQGVTLTVTPLSGLAGAPTTLLGGVRLQPTGLRLLQNATLTITPPTPPAAPASVKAFRFYDGGADAGMYPIDAAHSSASATVLSINELATYAVGTSTPDQVATALAHPPARTDGQLDNVLGALPATAVVARVSARAGAASEPTTQRSAADDYYDHVLRPNLVKAETNDALARSAVTAALGWSHQMAVLGGEDDPRLIDAITEMLKVMHNAVIQEYTRCKADHQLLDLGRLLGNARSYAVLGATADADGTFDKAKACGQFTFAFDDTLTGDQYYPPGQSGYQLHEVLDVGTVAPITMKLDQYGAFTGTGTIAYRTATYSGVTTVPGPTCTLTQTMTITGTDPGATDGVGAHLSVDLQPNFTAPGTGVPVVTAADGLVYLQGLQGAASWPTEHIHQQDAGCSSQSNSYDDQMWELQFHHYPPGGSAAPVIPVPASAQNGATVIDRTYSWDNGAAGDISGAHDTETATITVTHVPQ